MQSLRNDWASKYSRLQVGRRTRDRTGRLRTAAGVCRLQDRRRRRACRRTSGVGAIAASRCSRVSASEIPLRRRTRARCGDLVPSRATLGTRTNLNTRFRQVPSTEKATLVHAVDNFTGQMGAFDRRAKATGEGRWPRFDRC